MVLLCRLGLLPFNLVLQSASTAIIVRFHLKKAKGDSQSTAKRRSIKKSPQAATVQYQLSIQESLLGSQESERREKELLVKTAEVEISLAMTDGCS